MSFLTRPQGRIPLAWVTIKDQQGVNQRVPAIIDIEWDRYLNTLTERVGGIVGPTNLVQYISQTATPAVVLSDSDCGSVEFIPGPPGLQGAQGPQGYAMQGEQGEQGEQGFPVILNRSATALDATASRSLDTTFTNVSIYTLLVHLTIRCAVTLAGGNAFAQAKMDTASPPTVIATGLVGIQAGLLGEDNTFQLVFLVNPGGTYRIVTSATNGTVTKGSWFEFELR